MDEKSGRYGIIEEKNMFSNLKPVESKTADEDSEEDGHMRMIRHLVDQIEDEAEQLVPIISNSMRTDWILDYDFNRKLGGENGQKNIETPELSHIEHQFAHFWASNFKDGYPFEIPSFKYSVNSVIKEFPEFSSRADDELVSTLTEMAREHEEINEALRRLAEYNHLARVAHYRQIIPEGDGFDPARHRYDIRREANKQYLKVLKSLLYTIATNDPYISRSLVEELGEESESNKSLVDQYSFSELAQDLGYPRFNAAYPDLLRKLAQLPLPVYITTSYFDFLERLLQAEGKRPQTQICFYQREPANVLPEHKSRDIIPSVQEPVVFHLYGYEKYPSSMVLSEADYLDFLTAIAKDHDSKAPKIPLYVRDALTGSALLILGYRLLSWDFRILIRTILNRQGQQSRKSKVALQLDPKHEEAILDNERALSYIGQFFDSEGFELAVGDTAEYVKALWGEWDGRPK